MHFLQCIFRQLFWSNTQILLLFQLNNEYDWILLNYFDLLIIYHQYLEAFKYRPKSCWRKLFDTLCVTDKRDAY